MTHAPSGFFVLRTPLLPMEEWLALCASAHDPTRLRAALRALVNQPDIREALFVASPDLEATLDVWDQQPDSERGRRIQRSLLRYVARMATRPTPFGLFAGVSVGSLGDHTTVALAPRERYQRHTRLDSGYLDELAHVLSEDQERRRALRYRPNSSLFPAGGRMRYVESRRKPDGGSDGDKESDPLDRSEFARSYSLADVGDTKYLRFVLAEAGRNGGASLDELASALASQHDGITVERATRYIEELVENQLLLPDLPLNITGPEPLAPLAATFRALTGDAAAQAAADALERVNEGLETLDASGVGSAPTRYRALAANLEPLGASVKIGRLFQVDLHKPAVESTMTRRVAQEIRQAVELLHGMQRRGTDSLARFRERFIERYEGRWMPLLEVLDEESGIGLGEPNDPEPLLRTLNLLPSNVRESDVRWGARETHLLRLLSDSLGRGGREISLERADIDKLTTTLPGEPTPLPKAFAVVATVAAPSSDAIDRGDYRVYVKGADGPSGARMLGRFCHGDAELERRVLEHLRAEESLEPDAIFAEVVHSPAGRLGNILLRPVLREHEIVFLGRSGAPPERQLSLADLFVGVSGNRIALRCRDGRPVMPRLTSAHNHAMPTNLAAYRFLCALQGQGTTSAGWDWGPLANAPYLPRVRYGRVVLSLARWHADTEELRAFATLSGEAMLDAIRAWRDARGIPGRVAVVDGDNLLAVDLTLPSGADLFVHLAKDREQGIVLQEFFPDEKELWVTGPEGHFTSEIIIPFVETPSPSDGKAEGEARPRERQLTLPRIRRQFAPGSEWLYAKIYGGTATADRGLRSVVAPVVRHARSEGLSDRWFFIRYGDPHSHLRVRFHGEPEVLRSRVLAALHEQASVALGHGSAWRLQLDTYEREVERYGGDEGIELMEQFFEAESDAVLEIIERALGLSRDDRWRVAVYGVDRLLRDLGFADGDRRRIVERARDDYRREHQGAEGLGRQIGDKFRAERKRLESLLTGDLSSFAAPVAIAIEALDRRSERVKAIAAELRQRDADGRLTTPLALIAPSLTHMFAIRLLRASARSQELVIYDFLARLYESRAARERAGQRVVTAAQVALPPVSPAAAHPA